MEILNILKQTILEAPGLLMLSIFKKVLVKFYISEGSIESEDINLDYKLPCKNHENQLSDYFRKIKITPNEIYSITLITKQNVIERWTFELKDNISTFLQDFILKLISVISFIFPLRGEIKEFNFTLARIDNFAILPLITGVSRKKINLSGSFGKLMFESFEGSNLSLNKSNYLFPIKSQSDKIRSSNCLTEESKCEAKIDEEEKDNFKKYNSNELQSRKSSFWNKKDSQIILSSTKHFNQKDYKTDDGEQFEIEIIESINFNNFPELNKKALVIPSFHGITNLSQTMKQLVRFIENL